MCSRKSIDDDDDSQQEFSNIKQYHSIQTLRLTAGHPRQEISNSSIESIYLSEPTSPTLSNQYGYLEHIQSYKSLPRKVR